MNTRHLVMLLLLGISGSVGAVRWPLRGGTLTIPTLRPSVRRANPVLDRDTAQIWVALYDTLFVVANNGGHLRTTPHLVESEPLFANRQTRVTLKLRERVRLSDGKPLTAAQVKWSLQSMPLWLSRPFRRITTPDANTLLLELRYPVPHLKALLAHPRSAVMVRASGHVPLGTGPFRVEQNNADGRVSLSANPYHFRGLPYVDHVRFLPFPSHDREIDSFYLDQIDVSYFESSMYDRKSKKPRRVRGREQGTLYLVFNGRSKRVQTPAVRGAIWRAINLTNLQRFLPRATVIPSNLLPASITGYQLVPHFRRGPKSTRGNTPTQLVIMFNRRRAGHRAIAKAILTDLGSSLGVASVRFEPLDDREFYRRLEQKSGFDCALVEHTHLTRSARVALAALVGRFSPSARVLDRVHDGMHRLSETARQWHAQLLVVPLLDIRQQLFANGQMDRYPLRPDGLLDLFEIWRKQ